jgi:hypothetical protein
MAEPGAQRNRSHSFGKPGIQLLSHIVTERWGSAILLEHYVSTSYGCTVAYLTACPNTYTRYWFLCEEKWTRHFCACERITHIRLGSYDFHVLVIWRMRTQNSTVILIYEGVPKSFRTESITKYTLTTKKRTRLTHKTALQLHLVSGRCTICSSRSRRPVRKLLDTPSYNPWDWWMLLHKKTVRGCGYIEAELQSHKWSSHRNIHTVICKTPFVLLLFCPRAPPNWAPLHEGVLGSGGTAPPILWPRH